MRTFKRICGRHGELSLELPGYAVGCVCRTGCDRLGLDIDLRRCCRAGKPGLPFAVSGRRAAAAGVAGGSRAMGQFRFADGGYAGIVSRIDTIRLGRGAAAREFWQRARSL